MQVALFLRDDQKRFVVSQMELDHPQWTTEMSQDHVAQFHFGTFFLLQTCTPPPHRKEKENMTPHTERQTLQVLTYTLSTSSWAVKWTRFLLHKYRHASSCTVKQKGRSYSRLVHFFSLHNTATKRQKRKQLKIRPTKMNSTSCISLDRMMFIRLCTHCPK